MKLSFRRYIIQYGWLLLQTYFKAWIDVLSIYYVSFTHVYVTSELFITIYCHQIFLWNLHICIYNRPNLWWNLKSLPRSLCTLKFYVIFFWPLKEPWFFILTQFNSISLYSWPLESKLRSKFSSNSNNIDWGTNNTVQKCAILSWESFNFYIYIKRVHKLGGIQ